MPNLRYIAARIGIGIAHADEIRSTVDSLLEESIYSDEFLSVLDSKPARLGEVLPPFTAYLQHEGIRIPSRDEAVWQLIAYHVSRILPAAVDPVEEMQQMMIDVYSNYDFHSSSQRFIGDSHGIEYLISLYWDDNRLVDLNGIPNHEEMARFKESLCQRARDWMNQYGGAIDIPR